MAKKNPSTPKATIALPPVRYAAENPWWPAEFASPRFALMQVVFLVLLGLLLYVSSLTNSLLGVKSLVAWVLGAYDPLDLGANPMSLDICVLIWCGFFVAGNALLHPVLGLVSLAFLRPWLDGYTFKSDNVYFLWACIFILALWGVRALIRNEPLRFPILTLMASGYVLLALVLSPWSFNFGEAYRQLLNWTGYVAAFIIATQNMRSRRVTEMALTAIVFGMAGQALFAVLQFFYVLPFLRELINQDPSVLRQYFGVENVTADMRHRFNKNRAFGTVLFPNALAAFLILGIPTSIALALRQYVAFLPFWKSRQLLKVEDTGLHRRSCLAASTILWLAVTTVLFSAMQFPATHRIGPPPWYLDIYFLLGACMVAAAIPTFFYGRTVLRGGFPMANAGALFLCSILSSAFMVWALWLSYSRGGILALLGGAVIAGIIAVSPRGVLLRALRWTPRFAALALLVGAGWFALASVPGAGASLDTTLSTAAPEIVLGQTPTTGVTREGQNVSFAELTNPESFSLRLTYWRVGLRIFAEHWLTGVGLANFKWAYPVYQQPGDGNVQEGHNSFLQAFVETGILGGLLLSGFWFSLLAWAAYRIAETQDRDLRRILIALFAGLVAFLLHAAIDINFAHPTLMFYAMLFGGMLCALGGQDAAPEAGARVRTPALVAILIAATFAMGFSTRPYFQNLILSRMQFMAADAADALMDRLTVANYVMIGAPTARVNKTPPRPIAVRSLALFDIDLKEYIDVSRVYEAAQDGSRKLVPAADGSPITPVSQLLFVKPWRAAQLLEEDVRPYLEELKQEDARFPYDPQLAIHLSNWYQTLTHFPDRYWIMSNGDFYYNEMMRWSNEAVARNPNNADVYVNLAESEKVLWLQNRTDLGPLERAVDLHRKACQLAPAQPVFQYQLAEAMKALAQECRSNGDTARADALMAEREAALEEWWRLARFGMKPMPRPDIDAPQPAGGSQE